MSSLNKVMLIGNIGQEPETKKLSNDDILVNISVATNSKVKDKETGQYENKVEWHRVVLFGQAAKFTAEYLKKGSKVYIEGSLKTNKWQDKNGQDRYTTQIVSYDIKSMGGDSKYTQDQADVAPRANSGSIDATSKSISQEFASDDVPF